MRAHWEVYAWQKKRTEKTDAELAQDLSTRPDSLIHLTAKARNGTKSRRTGPVAELDHVRFRW